VFFNYRQSNKNHMRCERNLKNWLTNCEHNQYNISMVKVSNNYFIYKDCAGYRWLIYIIYLPNMIDFIGMIIYQH